jgi:hypothetical protein
MNLMKWLKKNNNLKRAVEDLHVSVQDLKCQIQVLSIIVDQLQAENHSLKQLIKSDK